jgi:hypothetical protein
MPGMQHGIMSLAKNEVDVNVAEHVRACGKDRETVQIPQGSEAVHVDPISDHRCPSYSRRLLLKDT